MNDDRFDDLWPQAAEDYHRPPQVPADLMWQRIQQRRQARRAWYRRPIPARVLWPVAAAAVLVLGIAIGRVSQPQRAGEEPAQPMTTAQTGIPQAATVRSGVDLYQLAAAEYLGRTEAVLAAFHREREPAERAEVGAWARDLLLETRLLLDSPAARPDAMQLLLTDLEMILAQIVQMDVHDGAIERRWIEASLDERSILKRLQQTRPAAASRRG